MSNPGKHHNLELLLEFFKGEMNENLLIKGLSLHETKGSST